MAFREPVDLLVEEVDVAQDRPDPEPVMVVNVARQGHAQGGDQTPVATITTCPTPGAASQSRNANSPARSSRTPRPAARARHRPSARARTPSPAPHGHPAPLGARRSFPTRPPLSPPLDRTNRRPGASRKRI